MTKKAIFVSRPNFSFIGYKLLFWPVGIYIPEDLLHLRLPTPHQQHQQPDNKSTLESKQSKHSTAVVIVIVLNLKILDLIT